MTDILNNGIRLTDLQRFFMMLPLCLSVAIIYKTTRTENMREVPVAVLGLWATIVVGMLAVGVGLWLLFIIIV